MGYIAIAVDPTAPFNPYPPPTPSSPLSCLTTPGSRSTPSPVALSPRATGRDRPDPTPLRPATLTPSPAPALSFGATVELQASPDCTWAGLAGTVSSFEGEPLEGYPVHVWGPGLDAIVLSGSAPAYGPSGWEVVVGEAGTAASGTWHVQLHQHDVLLGHPPLSPVLQVDMTGSCQESLAIIDFEQHKGR